MKPHGIKKKQWEAYQEASYDWISPKMIVVTIVATIGLSYLARVMG